MRSLPVEQTFVFSLLIVIKGIALAALAVVLAVGTERVVLSSFLAFLAFFSFLLAFLLPMLRTEAAD